MGTEASTMMVPAGETCAQPISIRMYLARNRTTSGLTQ
jgi:hypothetical protein